MNGYGRHGLLETATLTPKFLAKIPSVASNVVREISENVTQQALLLNVEIRRHFLILYVLQRFK